MQKITSNIFKICHAFNGILTYCISMVGKNRKGVATFFLVLPFLYSCNQDKPKGIRMVSVNEIDSLSKSALLKIDGNNLILDSIQHYSPISTATVLWVAPTGGTGYNSSKYTKEDTSFGRKNVFVGNIDYYVDSITSADFDTCSTPSVPINISIPSKINKGIMSIGASRIFIDTTNFKLSSPTYRLLYRDTLNDIIYTVAKTDSIGNLIIIDTLKTIDVMFKLLKQQTHDNQNN